MDWKTKSIAVFSIVLMLTVIVGSFGVSSGVDVVPGTDSVSWDFYVVGGVAMGSPALPVKDTPSDANFEFGVTDGSIKYPAYADGPGPQSAGFDWGQLTRYSYDLGSIDVVLERGYAEIQIKNNLAVDIVITNLTAEVTDGTGGYDYWHNYAGMNFFNYTMVWVDILDWYLDEVDYNTGDVDPQYDAFDKTDAHCKWLNTTGGLSGGTYPLNGTHRPWNAGPAPLLDPDQGGDAALTNHTPPILVAAGANFTEYMGMQAYGNLTGWDGSTHTVGPATFTGTITLTMSYRRVCSPNSLDVQNVEISGPGYPAWPLTVNVTVKNTGGSPIDFDIRVLTFKDVIIIGQPLNFDWLWSTFVDTGSESVVGLGAGASAEYAVDWDLRADKPYGDFEAIGIAFKLTGSGSGGCDYYEEFSATLFIKAPGDVSGDRVIDSTDLGGLGVSWGRTPPDPLYNPQCDFNLDNVVDSTDLGGMGINWGISY